MKEFSYLQIDGEETTEAVGQVAEETPLSIFINGRHFDTAMMSPAMAEEFVAGHLFSEGIIGGLIEIESLVVEEKAAKVVLRDPMRAMRSKWPIVGGCGGTDSFLDASRLPKIASDFSVERSEILAAMEEISRSDLHLASGGVHSVGIFDGDGIICRVEDIGRHSALDKAIGRCLLEGVDLGEAFIASTGRVSSDMALKCSFSGVPVVASRGATTNLAIEIASQTGLSIIGFARGRKMNVYTCRERVAVRQPPG
jgi:FdhD protein